MHYIRHKILSNGFSEAALTFGLRQLDIAILLWKDKGPYQRSWFLFDSWIRIKHDPPFQYIWVQTSGGAIYEFATGAFDEIALGFVDTSGVQLHSSKPPLALYSMTFPSPPDDPPVRPDWRDVAPGYFFKRDGTETSFFTDFLSFQPQGVNEAAWWPDNKTNGVVHSAWSMPLGRMNTIGLCDALHSDGGTKGQCTYYSGRWQFYNEGLAKYVTTYFTSYTPLGGPLGFQWYTTDRVGTTAVPQFDRLFDIPPVYYRKGSLPLGGIGPYVDDYTWYRHGAVIESNLGNLFFVLADSKGGFLFYRAKAYWADEAVLDACVDQPGFPGVKAPASTAVPFKREVPNYPPWVTLPADGVETPQQWWNWQFNKDATKAVTVAMNSEDRAGFFHHVDADDPNIPSNPAWWEEWFIDAVAQVGGVGLANNVLYFDESKKGSACRKDLPGLIEVEISVFETGSGDLSFIPAVNVSRSDYFGNTGRYWVDAGYAYPGLSVEEDSLITAEIECYRETARWFHKINPVTNNFSDGAVDGSDYDPSTAWIHIKDFGSSWVVKSGVVELAREVLQVNAQILAFLPTYSPTSAPFDSRNAPWVLNNAGRYWTNRKIDRLSLTPGQQISLAKGMFTCGSTTYPQTYFDEAASPPLSVHSAEIVTADLRSLSYVVRQQKNTWPGTSSGIYTTNLRKTVQHKVVAFGEEQALEAPAGRTRNMDRGQTFSSWLDDPSEDVRSVRPPSGSDVNQVDYEPFTMPSEPETKIPMDKDLHEQLFTTVGLSRLPCYSHHEIRTTPKGDWSIWINDADAEIVDIIAPTGKAKTSHRAEFNRAFGKSLASDYFGLVSATAGYRNTGGFGLARNWLVR